MLCKEDAAVFLFCGSCFTFFVDGITISVWLKSTFQKCESKVWPLFPHCCVAHTCIPVAETNAFAELNDEFLNDDRGNPRSRRTLKQRIH